MKLDEQENGCEREWLKYSAYNRSYKNAQKSQ
jgi:hypothetical protein